MSSRMSNNAKPSSKEKALVEAVSTCFDGEGSVAIDNLFRKKMKEK